MRYKPMKTFCHDMKLLAGLFNKGQLEECRAHLHTFKTMLASLFSLLAKSSLRHTKQPLYAVIPPEKLQLTTEMLINETYTPSSYLPEHYSS